MVCAGVQNAVYGRSFDLRSDAEKKAFRAAGAHTDKDKCCSVVGNGALHAYYTAGLKAEGGSITEGIGQARITRNLEGLKVDFSFQIPDAETVQAVFDLVAEEGLVLGSSSGINVAGAARLARELGPGHTIVTVLCDSGTRYASRLFNPEFLRSKNLPVPPWLAAGRPALPAGVVLPA